MIIDVVMDGILGTAMMVLVWMFFLHLRMVREGRAMVVRQQPFTEIQNRRALYARINVLEKSCEMEPTVNWLEWWDEPTAPLQERIKKLEIEGTKGKAALASLKKEIVAQEANVRRLPSHEPQGVSACSPLSLAPNHQNAIPQAQQPWPGMKLYRAVMIGDLNEASMAIGDVSIMPTRRSFTTVQLPYEMLVDEADRWKAEYIKHGGPTFPWEPDGFGAATFKSVTGAHRVEVLGSGDRLVFFWSRPTCFQPAPGWEVVGKTVELPDKVIYSIRRTHKARFATVRTASDSVPANVVAMTSEGTTVIYGHGGGAK